MKNMNRPAPLCGVSCKLTRRPCKTVQSTHPRGVRHLFEHGHQLRQIISTHAPREGCDQSLKLAASQANQFQSTHPARGATGSSPSSSASSAFQSTHPARGATLDNQLGRLYNPISIHAPREGCDGLRRQAELPEQRAISIHAPREGCDRRLPVAEQSAGEFQSTHPARGATSGI